MNLKDYKFSGFSEQTIFDPDRLMKKDGTSNVRKIGIKRKFQRDLYHYLIHTSWGGFFIVILLGFSVLNAIFATLFFSLPSGQFSGMLWKELGLFYEWSECFFFSIQTFTTVGYGGISPTGFAANTISSFASFFGVVYTAIVTGLTYGRFSKPKTGLKFSKVCLVAPYAHEEAHEALMFRMAHARNSELSNVEIRVLASWISEKTNKRKYANLGLEMNRINLLSTVWTVVHPLRDESPILEMASDTRLHSDLEILVFVKGFDDTYSQEIHSRTSFKGGEIIRNARFNPIFQTTLEGPMAVNLSHLSAYSMLKNQEHQKAEKRDTQV